MRSPFCTYPMLPDIMQTSSYVPLYHLNQDIGTSEASKWRTVGGLNQNGLAERDKGYTCEANSVCAQGLTEALQPPRRVKYSSAETPNQCNPWVSLLTDGITLPIRVPTLEDLRVQVEIFIFQPHSARRPIFSCPSLAIPPPPHINTSPLEHTDPNYHGPTPSYPRLYQ